MRSVRIEGGYKVAAHRVSAQQHQEGELDAEGGCLEDGGERGSFILFGGIRAAARYCIGDFEQHAGFAGQTEASASAVTEECCLMGEAEAQLRASVSVAWVLRNMEDPAPEFCRPEDGPSHSRA